MSKLIRFLDSRKGCWSRVDIEDGSPIFISVARNGILIKQSKLGILGRKLYKEDILYRLTKTCMTMSEEIDASSLPDAMQNDVLRIFTQLALDSASTQDLMSKLFAYSNK